MKRLTEFIEPAVLILLLVCCAERASADIKIKSKSVSSGHSAEQTTYIKGKRQRSEQSPQMVTITQCDLRRSVELNPMTKTYIVTPFDQNDPASANVGRSPAVSNARRGGVVTTSITATDTGERKQMFGHTARRIKTSMVTESSPEACNQNKSRMETDGWYIDIAFDLNCGGQNSGGYQPPLKSDGCRDEYRTRQTGGAKTGYPVAVTTTFLDENGKPNATYYQEVVEFSQAALDDGLFDIPGGYTEVKDRQQMFSAAALMNAALSGKSADTPSSTSDGDKNAGNNVISPVLPPKRAGVIRIGVVPTETNAAGDRMNRAALGEATRNTLITSMNRPNVEAVALTSRLQQEAELEARQKECDFIVYTIVSHKRGGGLGGFLSKAAPIAELMTGGSESETGTAGDNSAAGVSKSVKAKDELTLIHKLQAVNSSPLQPVTFKAKARSDGEDIISPVVTQTATALLNETAKK